MKLPELIQHDDKKTYVQINVPLVVSFSVPKDNQYELEEYKQLFAGAIQGAEYEYEMCMEEVDSLVVTAVPAGDERVLFHDDNQPPVILAGWLPAVGFLATD
jgi:hypothetical protein